MNTNRQKSNWLLDTLLFAGFIVSFFLDLTGLPLHQWIGVLGGILAVYHLALHWDWVQAVTQRFFGKTSGQARGYYLLDSAILLGFFLIVANGLVISTWLDLPLANYAAWKDFHVTTSIVTLALVIVKIGLHWRWIARVACQPLFPQPVPAARPVRVAGAMTRRDFLKLMSIVGAASILAVHSAISDGQVAQASSLTTSSSSETDASGSSVQAAETETTSSAPSPMTAVSQGWSASTCTVRCNKHCSYPGQCRRYQDTNGDGICDESQCL